MYMLRNTVPGTGGSQRKRVQSFKRTGDLRPLEEDQRSSAGGHNRKRRKINKVEQGHGEP